MGYYCNTCYTEIPGGEEIWLDRWARPADWSGRSGRPVDPGPYHQACGRVPDLSEPEIQEPIKVHVGPRATPKPISKPKSKDGFDLSTLPKPKQISLFEKES